VVKWKKILNSVLRANRRALFFSQREPIAPFCFGNFFVSGTQVCATVKTICQNFRFCRDTKPVASAGLSN